MKYTFQVLLENKLIFTFCITQEVFSPETWTLWGVKLIFFFSDSHLAPKFFKVVANSKEVGRHFQRQTNPFFYAVIVLEIKLGKRSLTCYKVDTRMDDIQPSSSLKSKMASSYRSRCMCCVLEASLMRKSAADLP